MTQDDIRANFLSALDRSDVNVTAWEGSFLDTCLGQFNFSRKQAAAIDRMMDKYKDQIDFDEHKVQSVAHKAAQETARLKRDMGRCKAVAAANAVMPDPSVAIQQYLAAPQAKRQILWKYLLASEREALIKAGKK